MQCMKEYTSKLAEAVKENKTMMNFDGFLYIIGSIPMFILTLILLVSNFVLYAMDGMTQTELVLNIFKYLVPTFVLPSLTAAFVMWLDGKPIKPMIKGLFTYPLFMGSWLLINFKCLFKRETNWEKITHNRSIKIDDVSEKVEEIEKIKKKLAFMLKIGYNIDINIRDSKEWEQIPLFTFENKGGKKWQV